MTAEINNNLEIKKYQENISTDNQSTEQTSAETNIYNDKEKEKSSEVSVHTDNKTTKTENSSIYGKNPISNTKPKEINEHKVDTKKQEESKKLDKTATNPIFNTNQQTQPLTAFSTKPQSKVSVAEALVAELPDSVKVTPETRAELEKLYKEGKFSKEDVLNTFRQLKKLADEHNVDLRKIPKELSEAYVLLSLRHKAGTISDSEFLEIRSKCTALCSADRIKEILKQNNNYISDAQVNEVMRELAKLSATSDIMATENTYGSSPEDTKKKREQFLLKASSHREKGHKELLKRLSAVIPENCDENVAKRILSSAGNFTKTEFEILKKYIDKKGFSTTFKNAFENLSRTIYKKNETYSGNFIIDFFKSEKGKSIKTYASNVVRSYFREKENAEEVQEKTAEITLEAKQAEKEAQIAKENAQKAIDEAKGLIAGLGINPDKINNQKKKELVKEFSPMTALKCQRAFAAKASADKTLSNAEISVEFAREREAWANKKLAFAQARLSVLMQKVMTLMSC